MNIKNVHKLTDLLICEHSIAERRAKFPALLFIK